MASKQLLTNDSLLALLEKQRCNFTDHYRPLLTSQEVVLQKATSLLTETRESMRRNHGRQKAFSILNDVKRCISPDVFLLCALATNLSTFGTSKLCNYVSTIGSWWEAVHHPKGLTLLSQSYGLSLSQTPALGQDVSSHKLEDEQHTKQNCSEPRSLNDTSPENHTTIFTGLERPQKRKLSSINQACSEHMVGATNSLGLERSEALIYGRTAGPQETPLTSDEEAQQGVKASPLVVGSSMIVQGRTIERASLAEVFGKEMCDAIWRVKIRNNGTTFLKAAATMNFPLWGLVNCVLSLGVREERYVEQLAMALFKVQVELVGHGRHIILPGGVSLTPNPEVTLKGVMDDAIISVFGPMIYKAIASCRMRTKELEEGSRVTECVSMILTSNPDDGAIVNLFLGLKEGIQIRNKLYCCI